MNTTSIRAKNKQKSKHSKPKNNKPDLSLVKTISMESDDVESLESDDLHALVNNTLTSTN